MYDSWHRRIRYLRISVTRRCNLNCTYCRPIGGEGSGAGEPWDLLSFEEIHDVVGVAVRLGFDKFRLTGGEPLLREGIVDLVRMLTPVVGPGELAITTNGVHLAGFAAALRSAGVRRVNVSLDSVDARRYRELTGGELAPVMEGLAAARLAGFRTIKLNCVIEASPDEPDARAVAAYGQEHGHAVRFIRRMDLAAGRFWPVIGGKGGACEQCDRLRLSSDGRVFPCLFSDVSFSVREQGAEAALRRAVEAKPESGRVSREKEFYEIGG